MVIFNEEHKVEQDKYFSIGIHKVSIVEVVGGINDNDKEYIEFAVEGDDHEIGLAKTWFTTDKAIKYGFNTIRAIFVHNAQENKKEAAKEMVEKAANTDELVALCNKVLIGKEAWYTVEKSDYTYVSASGEEKHGYNRNITGYEPKPKPSGDAKVDETFGGGTVLNDSEVPNDL